MTPNFLFELDSTQNELTSVVYHFSLKINNEYVLEEESKKIFSIQIENSYNECHKNCIKNFLQKIKDSFINQNNQTELDISDVLEEINSEANDDE